MASAISQAEAQLSLLINNFLGDEKQLESTFPLVIEIITLKNLLNPAPEQTASSRTLEQNGFESIKKNFSGQSASNLLYIDANELKKYDSTLQKFSSRLTSLLLSKFPRSRLAAVLLIKQSCEQSLYILFQHAEKWIMHLINLLSKSEILKTQEAAISALISILDTANNYTDLQRDIVTPNVSKFNVALISLIKTNIKIFPAVSNALVWTCTSFPGLMRTNSEKAIKACLQFLDGSYVISNPKLVMCACECISSLSTVGGKNNSSERWLENFSKTITTIDITLNKVYQSVDTAVYEGTKSHYDMDFSFDDYIVGLPLLVDRCASLTELVVSFLTNEVKDPVMVPVEEVIHIINRLGSVNSKTKVIFT
ncbi:hypothetical protein BB559_001740 [Furculomyces boomerangus]|uniref:Pre-rRNA-processing protein RIX1 n=2 Tax=Harpellales TaxID=61421 RepID=A0A2T9Z0Y6_9FUNG|nr:hypothetical protein BB559_005658 [Furculomyces boomerangus]PVU98237.1 hypothetical protein BB559_001740 [Furculomyces boomerangus]PWA03525.1 hypothetical protein BB558_000309 [Smittium angustum]